MNYGYSKAMGANLAHLRQQKGYTQEQLSARMQVLGCDMTRSALAKVEVGQRHLYPDELKAIKLALNISYEELFI